MIEVFCVVTVPFLEGRLADTEVTGVTTWFIDSCLINNTALEALSVQRAVFLDPTVTQFFLSARLCLLLFSLDLDIMAMQNCFHIGHTAVAQFDCIFIEQLMVLMITWKMFGEQAEEILANI